MAKHFLIALWLVFAPLAANAQTHCDAIIPLAEIQAALERVAAPGHRRVAQDLDIVHRTLLRIDRDSIAYALRDHPLATQTDTFGAFLELAGAITARAQANGNAVAPAVLAHPDIKRLMYSVNISLRPYPCRASGERRLQAIQTLEPGNLTGANQQTQFGITARQAMITFGMSVLLVGLCLFIIRRQIKRLELKRRRQKRYYVRLPCTLTVSAGAGITESSQSATIVDISSEGAKLLHHFDLGDKKLTKASLIIDGTLRPATVKWHNAHCAGIKFDTRMALPTLRSLVRKHRPRTNVTGFGPRKVPSNA